MFVDQTKVKLIAGKGGDGVVAWRREKYIPKGGPCGGNGGRGGSIYLETDPDLYSLESFRNRREIKADKGLQGGSNHKQGKSGKDLRIKVPCGTLIKEAHTGHILYDLTEKGEKVLLCEGGKGGKGNDVFKTATNQAPNRCTLGKEGGSIDIELELKLIADIGFVGMPNAGKSTLLSKITTCQAKIGAYPFTTLKPNLSFIEFDDYSRIHIADIPGIIKDASVDRGLGLNFLKHIERCNSLIFLIDLTGIERGDPFEDFTTLRNEICSYSKLLSDTPFLVLLNKCDLTESEEHLETFQKKYPFPKDTLFTISAKNGEGLESFITAMRSLAQRDGKRYY